MTEKEKIVMLETDLDDCTPEVLSYLMERVMQENALDIQVISAVMKKGRLGFLVRVLVREEDAKRLSDVLMKETGTLGVRVMPVLKRYAACRELVERKVIVLGETERVRIKKSGYNLKPEYDDVRELALKHGLSFRQILDLVEKSLVDD
ncbi:MAG: nickel insertion protein [Candidatus Altiarchaeota archaeon]|nr:nickel insertion protein [Candidatus Altiarchaeota archaeon]